MTELNEKARNLLSDGGYLGDGETHDGLWFLGFRGGGETGPELQKWWKPDGTEDKTDQSTISLFESIFSAAVSRTEKNCVRYENEHLWHAGSGTAHINLFPIEGPGTEGVTDEEWDKYGFKSNPEYEETVRSVRFPQILKDIKSKEPAAVICFGITWEKEYRQCLGLENAKCTGDEKKRIRIFEDRKILIMNHFGHNWITQYDRLTVVKKLAEWKVQIP
jgi:hypothetical protein